MARKKQKPQTKWKHSIYENVMGQIDSYEFSENEKYDIKEILNDIIDDPLRSATKKLKGFQHTYCAYYVRTIFVNIDGMRRIKNDHYRFNLFRSSL